jgi:hypothetical protein
MARNYILGGMGATQLQAGKPYFKRIVRLGGTAGLDRSFQANTPSRDGLTCNVVTTAGVNKGSISFATNAGVGDAGTGILATDGESKAWAAGASPFEGGELLMVEFPTTLRSVEINLEEAWTGAGAAAADGVLEQATNGKIRVKAMLTAPGQDVAFDKGIPVLANPIGEGNFIEIKTGETATISSRTKVVFLLIQKFAGDTVITNAAAMQGEGTGHAKDAVSILITGVLDHEPTSGGSQAANEPNSQVIATDGTTKTELRKIWGKGEGVG